MNQPSANPYAPSASEVSTSAIGTRGHQLFPLWIWLGIAVVTSLLGAPADPISMLIALAFGLVSFCAGAMLGSSLNMIGRVLPVILWIALVILAISNGPVYYVVGTLCYGLASIANGFWACRRIENGRLRIIAWFSTGYVLGAIVGVGVGTVPGAVLGAILAKRSLARSGSTEIE